MDLLLLIDHLQSDISSLPSALIAGSRGQTSDSGNVVAFLAATSRMTLFKEGRLQRSEILSLGATFRVETCKDKKTGAIVAVKRLQGSKGTTNGSKTIDDSVLQEMMISVYPPILKHRNITQTLGYEIFHADGGACTLSLVTEFSEIGTLAQYLASGNSGGQFISWEQKRSFVVDISSGLEALHRCWIIHGDVKPDNILLFRESSPASTSLLVAKLNDFGSSIVEDAIQVQNISKERKLYVGTPMYVPPIVRESSGRVPFHVMPYCDAFSFGLLLWTIYKGRMYYETTWKDVGKTDQEYLNGIGIQGLKSHFEKFLADSKSVIPLQERKILDETFMACIEVNLAHHDLSIPLISSESILRAAFGHMSIVKRMLLPQEMNEDRNRPTSLGEVWQPFHLGTYSFEGPDDIPWTLQCSVREHFLSVINDPTVSTFQKGRAAIQLCSCSSIGFGCKKSINDAVEYLRTAATLKNTSAQLIIHRVYATHEIPPPILQLDKLPVSSMVDSEELMSELSDEYIDDVDEQGNETDSEEKHEVNHSLEPETSSNLELQVFGDNSDDSDSEIDLQYALFNLSMALDSEFWKSNNSANEYYCWNVRKFQKHLGDANSLVSLNVLGIEFFGLEDRMLLEHVKANWDVETVERLAQVNVEDGTRMEIPLLHHAVACGKADLVASLLEFGADLGDVDDDGCTLLHVACRRGHRELADFFINKGIKASIADATGTFPLHWLWMFEDDDIDYIGDRLVRVAGANVNAVMEGNNRTVDVFYRYKIYGTALHTAVAVRNLRAVTVLLSLGADVNSRPFRGSDSPLELATQLHIPEIAEKLLACGASLRDERSGGWALHHVGVYVEPFQRWLLHGQRFREAAYDIIHILLAVAERERIDPDMTNKGNLTAFEVALSERGEDAYITEAFLTNNIKLPDTAVDMAVISCACDEENASKLELILKILEPVESDLQSALFQSVQMGAVAAARLILNCSESSLLHIRDEKQQTPLHWAAKAGRWSMSRLLVDQGADLDTVDINGVPPIGYALSVGSTTISKLLLDNGCNIWLNEGEWQNSTILNFGLSVDQPNSKSILSFLLSADLDEHEPRRFPALHPNEVLNAADQGRRNTVLHRAAANGDYESVFSLISAGADREIKNNAGRTPLEEVERKLQDIVSSSDEEKDGLVTKLTKVITYMQL